MLVLMVDIFIFNHIVMCSYRSLCNAVIEKSMLHFHRINKAKGKVPIELNQ